MKNTVKRAFMSNPSSSDSGKKEEPPDSTNILISSPAETVLVVDDSDIAREAMLRMLKDAGMRALELASPIGATRTILNNKVEVVVIDVLMPGMRGDRLASLFRGNPRFKRLAVVLVSGEQDVDLERMAREAGADAAVSKSRLSDLVPTIRRALRRRAAVNG
jgi:PleD family two-component response regulator